MEFTNENHAKYEKVAQSTRHYVLDRGCGDLYRMLHLIYLTYSSTTTDGPAYNLKLRCPWNVTKRFTIPTYNEWVPLSAVFHMVESYGVPITSTSKYRYLYEKLDAGGVVDVSLDELVFISMTKLFYYYTHIIWNYLENNFNETDDDIMADAPYEFYKMYMRIKYLLNLSDLDEIKSRKIASGNFRVYDEFIYPEEFAYMFFEMFQSMPKFDENLGTPNGAFRARVDAELTLRYKLRAERNFKTAITAASSSSE